MTNPMPTMNPYNSYRIETATDAPDGIVTEMHCTQCMRERPTEIAPRDWARLKIGFHHDGLTLQVYCLRHEWNIAVMTPLGIPVH